MNGTEFARVSGSYNTAFIGSWSLLRQDIAGNYSVIRLYGTFRYGGGESVGSDYSTFTVNGVTISSGRYRYYPGDTQLGSTDITVYHNSDGSFPARTINITVKSYHMQGSVNGVISGISSIPRASGFSLSPSEAVVGQTVTANIYKANPSFYHRFRISFHGSEPTTDFTTEGSATLSVPESFADLLPSSATGTAKAYLYTYTSNYGASHIGTSEKNITVRVPNREPFAPTFNVAADATMGGKVPDNWVDDNGRKILVQGESEVKLMAYSVWAKYSAWMESVTIDGTPAQRDTGAEVPTYVLPRIYDTTSGDQSVTVRATDSRGNYTQQQLNFYVYPYAKPSFSEVSCERCDLQGNVSDSGTQLKVLAKGSVSSVGNRNSGTIKVMYRTAGSSSWTNEQTILDNTETILEGAVLTTKSYEVRFVLQDLLGNTAERMVRIPTEKVVLNIRPGGDGMAIGKYAERSSILEIDMETRLNKGLNMEDVPFLDAGSNENGSWMKFYNGIQICSTRRTVTIPPKSETVVESSAWIALPQPFMDTNYVSLATAAQKKAWHLSCECSGTDALKLWLLDENAQDVFGGSCEVSIVAIGRWK